jgi:hypothetical protein
MATDLLSIIAIWGFGVLDMEGKILIPTHCEGVSHGDSKSK